MLFNPRLTEFLKSLRLITLEKRGRGEFQPRRIGIRVERNGSLIKGEP